MASTFIFGNSESQTRFDGVLESSEARFEFLDGFEAAGFEGFRRHFDHVEDLLTLVLDVDAFFSLDVFQVSCSLNRKQRNKQVITR
jgi:predicted glycosyltransferase involved in capsule biosynthesis